MNKVATESLEEEEYKLQDRNFVGGADCITGVVKNLKSQNLDLDFSNKAMYDLRSGSQVK